MARKNGVIPSAACRVIPSERSESRDLHLKHRCGSVPRAWH